MKPYSKLFVILLVAMSILACTITIVRTNAHRYAGFRRTEPHGDRHQPTGAA